MDAVTIKDIAKECGVSVSTVSRGDERTQGYQSENQRKNPGGDCPVRLRAQQQCQKSENVWNPRAVALLVKGMDNMFFQDIIDVIEKEIHDRKIFPAFCSGWRKMRMRWIWLWNW